MTNRLIIVFALVMVAFMLATPILFPAQSQTPAVTYVKQFDDGSYLITVNGEQHWAVNLAKAKEIKSNEIKLREAAFEIVKLNDSLARTQSELSKEKMNVQDERVRVGKMQTMYDGQEKLATECFALLKKGGGKFNSFLDKPVVKLLRDVVPSAVQIATCK
jgi:hypothetical protein